MLKKKTALITGITWQNGCLFVLECMACQTPVIRTNDSDEEIEHEKTGFLFEKMIRNVLKNMS